MKRRLVTLSFIITVLTAALLLTPGCGKKGPGEEAPGGVDLLTMLPGDAAGVISVNFQKLSGLEFFDKMLKEEKSEKPGELFKNYEDFVNKTGIDLQRDVFAMAVAVMGPLSGPSAAGEPDVVAVANLNYDKAKITALVKEKAGELKEEDYNGIQVFAFKDDQGKDMMFSFISDNLAAIGLPGDVKKVIDLSKGTGKSVRDNEKMKPFLEQMKAGAIISFAIEFPEDAKKKQEGGMFQMDLTKAEAIIGFVDYADKNWNAVIRLLSRNEEGNQQLASTLNGLKMMGGAAGPEVGELVNQLNITASAEDIKMEVNISDELLEKLRKKMEEKAAPTAAPTEEEPQTEEEGGEN
jgi:hypothetical protein